MEPEETPNSATPLPPETEYVDGGNISEEGGKEPSVTSIPDGIDIPLENQTGGVEPKTNPKEEENTPIQEEIVYKSIWPPLFLAFTIGALVGSLILLTPLGRTNIVIPLTGETQPKTPQNTEVIDGQTRITLNTGFAQGGSLAQNIAKDRIAAAQSHIVWITNFPNNPEILRAIKENYKTTRLILIGSDARSSDAAAAQALGLQVLRAKQSFADNESILVIDNQYIVDISRQNTIWETVDPSASQTTVNWVDNLLNQATLP